MVSSNTLEQCVCLQSDRPNTVYKPIDYGHNIATVGRSLPQVNASAGAHCLVTVPTLTAAGKLRLFRNTSPSPISAFGYLILYCERNGHTMPGYGLLDNGTSVASPEAPR